MKLLFELNFVRDLNFRLTFMIRQYPKDRKFHFKEKMDFRI